VVDSLAACAVPAARGDASTPTATAAAATTVFVLLIFMFLSAENVTQHRVWLRAAEKWAYLPRV
jgi:hypothetical protein